MLKWAVNGSAARVASWQHEQQRIVVASSTPLHAYSASAVARSDLSALSRIAAVDALQDAAVTPPAAARQQLPSLGGGGGQSSYATTLPTFDVEYSPCGLLVPGPVLALRGIEIPDVYFEKPRYLADYRPPQLPPRTAVTTTTTMTTMTTTVQPPAKLPARQTNGTRSSNEMSDLTLERMIDAILENSCKDASPPPPQQRQRRQRRHPVLGHPHSTRKALAGMSPTYSRAEDPASDLLDDGYLLHSCGTAAAAVASGGAAVGPLFREREVCSPKFGRVRCGDNNNNSNNNGSAASNYSNSFQLLQRQRAVRRKGSSVSSNKTKPKLRTKSAQRFFDLGRRVRSAATGARHISPDSGRDSSSSLESTRTAGACDYAPSGGIIAAALDATKRRLSFSSGHTHTVSGMPHAL